MIRVGVGVPGLLLAAFLAPCLTLPLNCLVPLPAHSPGATSQTVSAAHPGFLRAWSDCALQANRDSWDPPPVSRTSGR